MACAYWREAVEYFYNFDISKGDEVGRSNLNHMADQIKLLWTDITEGEGDSPVLLTELLKEVDTSGWDASLEPVGADVFAGNEHVETSVSMDLLDTLTHFGFLALPCQSEYGIACCLKKSR